jgi:hypothetical protein
VTWILVTITRHSDLSIGWDTIGWVALALGLAAVGLAVYFVPTLIAALRGIPNAVSVAVVNLFLGWTFLGWVVALAMAVSGIRSNRAARG